MVDVRELLLGQLNSARRDIVYGILLQDVVPLIYGFLECRRLDFSTFVDEVDTEQFALTVLVVPCLDRSFV